MPSKKYFIAILIPEPIFSEIEAIKQTLYSKYGLKGALRSPAHITLHRPFEWKEEKENLLIEKLAQFKFESPFNIELKNFAFFEPRVIYVDVLQQIYLNDLHEQLTHFAKRELKLFNEAEDMRGFHPHVTIAFRDLKKNLYYELKKEFENKKFEASFIFKEFYLLKLSKTWEVFKCFKLITE